MTEVQIAESDREEVHSENTTPKKTEVSNNIDYDLDTIDEEKFQEFKKMTDYIKKNGWEYGDEYNHIMEKSIKPFERQIKDILNKSNVTTESKDLDSKSDEEIAREADEIIKNQPEELNQQKELIKKINWNGSPEEIQKLNEIVNDGMGEVQSFYDKIKNS